MDRHQAIRMHIFEETLQVLRCSFVVFTDQPKECNVAALVEAAIQHLKDIAETFGSQWTVEHLLLGRQDDTSVL